MTWGAQPSADTRHGDSPSEKLGRKLRSMMTKRVLGLGGCCRVPTKASCNRGAQLLAIVVRSRHAACAPSARPSRARVAVGRPYKRALRVALSSAARRATVLTCSSFRRGRSVLGGWQRSCRRRGGAYPSSIRRHLLWLRTELTAPSNNCAVNPICASRRTSESEDSFRAKYVLSVTFAFAVSKTSHTHHV